MNAHPNIEPVTRIEKLSPEAFRTRFDAPGKPVVIAGALSWPAFDRWSHEWFRDQFGATEVQLSVNPTHTRRVVKMRLGEYINRILNNYRMEGGLYLDQFPLERLPSLQRDFSMPEYCPRNRRVVPHLWLGPSTTVLSFHKDNHNPLVLIDNIFVQIRGRKRVIMASAQNDAFMYPRPPEAGAYWHSQVNPEAPDFTQFPDFRAARLEEAIVGPGDVLFIPRNYWHYVRALERSISMSFWWNRARLMEIAAQVSGMNEADLATPAAGEQLAIGPQDIEEFGGGAHLASVFAEFSDVQFLRQLGRKLGAMARGEARGAIATALEAALAKRAS